MSNNVNVAKSNLSVGYTNNNQDFVKFWNNNDTFNKVNNKFNTNPFVLLDGPPYANGDAHLGHALNKLLKDLVLKSKWFDGRSVEYRPGWDCHGLPLELAAEKKYQLNMSVTDTKTLKNKCKVLAFKSLSKQRQDFKNLGVLGQWKNPYLTLSKEMVNESWKTVKSLLSKNLLEYKKYPVHYCPVCASSLAEAELEQQTLKKDSLYFKVKLLSEKYDNFYALVWTTTPWTLPMNQGLAYNKDFKYKLYTNKNKDEYLLTQESNEVLNYLNSKEYTEVLECESNFFNKLKGLSPVTDNVVGLYHADFVEEGKTGFVHLSCAHGSEDFELGQQYQLEPFTYLNKNGVFESEHPNVKFLNGKKHYQVQELVVNYLKEKNLYVDYNSTLLEQNVCWRHKCAVYYNATYQVFLKLEDSNYNLKEKVSVLLKESMLKKEQQDKLSSMLLSRKNWCLSRQRKWGCPLNLLVNKKTNELNVSLSLEYLDLCLSQQDDKEFLENNSEYYVFSDVLDVWFDSGNVANYYASNNETDDKYVVDLVLEGKDQYRGWFQSLLWLTLARTDKMPYKNFVCHGFVLDENRHKLSKSKQKEKNSANMSLKDKRKSTLSDLQDTYGADLLRLWVASQEPELDAVFSNTKLEEMKRYYSRFRLCLRFLTSNLYDYDYKNHQDKYNQYKETEVLDLHNYMLKEMVELKTKLTHNYNEYEFKKGLELLYLFSDKLLSNFYFDWVKNPMYLLNKNNETRLMHQVGMYELLLGLFDLFKVYVPFVSEEFYQDYFKNNKSVFEEYYFNQNKVEQLKQLQVRFDWKKVQEMRKSLQGRLEELQQQKLVKARTEVGVSLYLNESSLFLKEVEKNYKLTDLFSVSEVNLLNKENDEYKLDEVYTLTNNLNYKKCDRCWNYCKVETFKNNYCKCCEDQF